MGLAVAVTPTVLVNAVLQALMASRRFVAKPARVGAVTNVPLVVDGQVAFVGSENISTASLDRNREVGILIADQAVLNTLQQTFQQDWQDSQAA